MYQQKHSKFDEVALLVEARQPVLLTGERGCGKTTLIQQVAEKLGLPFYCQNMTRQTTLSMLVGFRNVHGDYVRSQLREAVEYGGILLLDEIDAADANVLLALNTIENGFVSFPDGIINVHKDFVLVATANTQSTEYTGRSKLDAATLDRFDTIELHRDDNLERSLVPIAVYATIQKIRQAKAEYGLTKEVTMRDSLRLAVRTKLGLADSFIDTLLEHEVSATEALKLSSTSDDDNSSVGLSVRDLYYTFN